MSKFGWDGTWRGRAPASAPHKPARDIVRYTGAIVRGKFPSRKTGRMIGHEKLLELDAIYLFETAPQVATYVEQPQTITYPDGPRVRRYTPDFLLTLANGEHVVIEVKPRIYVNDPEVSHKLRRITDHMAREGRDFVILTDEVIRVEPRLSNLKWIYHQAPRIGGSRIAEQMALSKLGVLFPMSLRDAVTHLEPLCLSPFAMLISGSLVCDLTAKLSLDSVVCVAQGEPDEELFIAGRHAV